MKISSIVVGCLVLLAVFSPSVSAQGYGKDNAMQKDKMMREVTPGEGRMTACQAKAASIKKRMTHLVALAEGMEDKFDAHVERIKDYYTNKLVPSGKTVENYDELLSNVKTQEEVVEEALEVAEADAEAFSCTSGNPKEQARKFREDMQAVKKELKVYRTTIKDLIVAVRSVAGEESSPKPTE